MRWKYYLLLLAGVAAVSVHYWHLSWRPATGIGAVARIEPLQTESAAQSAGGTAAPAENQEGARVSKDALRLWTKPLKVEGKPLDQEMIAKAHAEGRMAAGRIAIFDLKAGLALDDLQRGQQIVITLPGGEEATGTLNLARKGPDGVVRVAGNLTDAHTGSFSFGRDGSGVAGRVLLQREKFAYVVSTLSADRVQVRELALSDVVCFPLPIDRSEPQAAPPGSGPVSAPPEHHSRPGATAVLYLDFDGATVTDPDWNDGNPISAAASTLSSAQITEVWNRVKEDYWPFNINVTTIESEYANAPVGRRMRVIITPSNAWYPDAGGVAYLDSFTLGGSAGFNADVPCWVFNSTVDGVAEAISHELGHTLGLSHDGQSVPQESYYEGHGDGATGWAPIMGAGYGRSLVQWSKGEYPSANNQEDDLAIIAGGQSTPLNHVTNNTGYIADEAGNDRATAAVVDAPAGYFSLGGIISTAADSDFYVFTLSAARTVTLSATPANSTPKQANLDILLELQDGSGTVLATANPDGALNASITQSLSAGTYYVKVAGTGRAGGGADYGYSGYGSIGGYSLVGTNTVPLPSFTVRPLSKLAVVGDTITLVAAATSEEAVSYQWKRNGQAIPGATSSTYNLVSAQQGDSGLYEIAASNAGGTSVSYFQVKVVAPGRAAIGWGYNDYGQSTSPAAGYPVAAVAGGITHSLALLTNGTVVSWGNSGYPETIVPNGLNGVVAIAAHGNTSMALKADGTVAVWGNNSYGQTDIPAGLNNVIAIAAGTAHCLALKADGTVVAWGVSNGINWGQATVPALLGGVVAIAAGEEHSLALKSDGTVVTWGGNFNYGSVAPPDGLNGVVAISAGFAHNLALKSDGTIVAWGFNYNGQATVPAEAIPAKAIVAGSSHSLALKADGTVVVWGHNYYGQLQVPAGLAGVSDIGAGSYHSLAIVAPEGPVITSQPQNTTLNLNGTVVLAVTAKGIPGPVYQWRKNGQNVVNNDRISGATTATLQILQSEGADAGNYDVVVSNLMGSVTSNLAAVAVTSPPQFGVRPGTRIGVVGQGLTLDATTSGASSYAWVKDGSLVGGATGPTLSIASLTPTDAGCYVVIATNSAGSTRAVFYVRVARANRVVAWGANDSGQSTVPGGLVDVVDISAGYAHTLALKPDGTVVAWGRNSQGQSSVPIGLTNVVQVSAGGDHSVALKSDGTVVAWGANGSGQSTVPDGLSGVVHVSAGGSHTVALKSDGTLVAWGANDYGKATIPGDMRFTSYVSAGVTHNIAVTDIGARGWGLDNFGQSTVASYLLPKAIQAAASHTVYLGSTGDVAAWGNIPVIPSVVNAVAISVRETHGLVLKDTGSVVAWGPNASGENVVPAGTGNVQRVAAGSAHSVVLVSPVPPTILTQPGGQSAASGTGASFSVEASGAATYQWMRNGVDLVEGGRFGGTTSAVLGIVNVQPEDAGNYTVRLTNTFGSTTSQTALLTVQGLIVVTNGGVVANQDGSLVTLSVNVTGSGAITYQWYAGSSGDVSAPVVGGNSNSLTVEQTTAQDSYWVRVSNGVSTADSRAIPIGKWTLIDPVFGSAELSATAYGAGKHVVVGTAAGYSTDATNWKVGTLETGASLRAVLFDGSRFLAAGLGGQVFTSDDGVVWSKRRPADTGPHANSTIFTSAYGNGISVFAGGALMSSSDGVDWQWRTVAADGDSISVWSVAFGAGRFVAVGAGSGYDMPRIYQSIDGVNWTRCSFSTKPFSDYYALNGLSQVVYLGGRFVALGQAQNSGTSAYYMTSSDGLNWTVPEFTHSPVSLNLMTLGGGQLLSGDFRTSSDGINWSASTPAPTRDTSALGYGNGVFVAVGSKYNAGYSRIATATDPTQWTTRVGYGIPANICFGNGRFVGVSRDSTGYSLDGVNWTTTPNSNLINYGEVTFGNGLFVSVSTYPYGTSHFTSTDGVTWIPRWATALTQYDSFSRIVYCGGQWIGLGGGRIYTSADAINWTLGASVGVRAIAYGSGRYVGVGYGGAVFVSDDGVSWSALSRPTTKDFLNIAYGAGAFVATDTENRLWHSTDGLQWTSRSVPIKNGGSYEGYITSLQFGGGRFLATYGKDILSSTDGLVWQVTPGALLGMTSVSNFQGKLLYADGLFWVAGTSTSMTSWFVEPGGLIPPVITAGPTGVTIVKGSTATLTVTASAAGLNYQWYRCLSGDTTQPIGGANGASYTTAALTETSSFWVRVTNAHGGANSPTVVVAIGPPPVINTHPANQTVVSGRGAVFSIAATGNPAPSYQWQVLILGANNWSNVVDGPTYTGAQTNTLHVVRTTLATDDGDQYRCVVSNAYGATASASATLTVRALGADFDDNGWPDILWRNPTSGQLAVWFMEGPTRLYSIALGTSSPLWQTAGTGDFNEDGQKDILWRNPTSGELAVWIMNGSTRLYSLSLGTSSPLWQTAGTGDFNGDGHVDILWRNPTSGELAVWIMNGSTRLYSLSLGTSSPLWQTAGTGDFNGDGQMDILWRNPTSGELAVWIMNATTRQYSLSLGTSSPAWKTVGTGDFNGDGEVDILWRNPTSGELAVWIMNGTTRQYSLSLGTSSPAWETAL